eukprot:393225_1
MMEAMFILMMLPLLLCNSIGLSETIEAETTFYGAKDNCPPGGDIAYPQIHSEAGGNGTYINPITYAGCKKATEPGTIIYVEFVQKYFIMEDDCEECDEDWITRKKWHMDLWMGPDFVTNGSKIIACEDALTKSRTNVIINPSKNLTVNTKPLFNGNTLECWQPNPPPCITKNPLECGNECEIPEAGTCSSIAAELLMSLQRFKELNPKIDCNRQIPQGTTVCMGGPCGD